MIDATIEELEKRLENAKFWARRYDVPVSSPYYSRSAEAHHNAIARDYAHAVRAIEAELKRRKEFESN